MKVKVKDMKPGDIFKCAYGHEENIIEAVFEKAEPDGDRWTKICFHRHEKMYDSSNYEDAWLEVIGHDHNYKD